VTPKSRPISSIVMPSACSARASVRRTRLPRVCSAVALAERWGAYEGTTHVWAEFPLGP
jgi:hypothetical protein